MNIYIIFQGLNKWDFSQLFSLNLGTYSLGTGILVSKNPLDMSLKLYSSSANARKTSVSFSVTSVVLLLFVICPWIILDFKFMIGASWPTIL